MIALALTLVLAGNDFERVELEAAQLPGAAGLERIREWTEQNGSSPELPHALLWQAQRLITLERFDEARSLLARALASNPNPELALDLALTQADVSALERRYDEAAREYDALPAPADSRWAMQASLRGQAMRGESSRHRAMDGLAALAGLLIATRLFQTRRGLWPPPEEVTWSVPVLLVLCLAALWRPPAERWAVLMVCLGGAGLLWLTGATLRTRTLTPLARLGELIRAAFLAGSLLFSAIVVSGLWSRVADTFAAGAE